MSKSEKRPCKRYLKYTFTREEKEKLSDELAHDVNDLKQKQLQKKETVKSLDSGIASLETEISRLATHVKDGYEFRDIECEMVFDYGSRMKIVTRLDEQTEVERTPMTAAELQEKLPLETAP
ncbi:MAG: hypothetical protein WC891_08775 [Actinomycetota bacterium]